ncbi:MAG: GntR family transcriptional regulator [Bacteroidota bacterium]
MPSQQLIKNSSQPKYKQIIAGIENAIRNGELKQGDQLPSLNTIKEKYNLSRDTVIMAFNDLKSRGIIRSVVGKGYYVKTEKVELQYKIFLLFDELNAFKEDLYNGFLEGLNDKAQVDIFFHHFNHDVFKSIIQENAGAYNYYVIMPANLKEASSVIGQLPKEQVFILDQLHDQLASYASIHQNFSVNMFKGLEQLKQDVLKYNQLVLVFNETKQPIGLREGFEKFCQHNQLNFEMKDNVDSVLKTETLYVSLDDTNLISLIKQMKIQGLEMGKEIGILCYNDTPLKEIVEGGITAISTNFAKMGSEMSRMILEGKRLNIESPLEVINRNSL